AYTGPWLDTLEMTNLGRMAANGAFIRKISDEAQLNWAKALADFPNERAQEANSKGLPGTKTLKLAVDIAEQKGHKWPVRYVIK
ncbi:MAG: hypothetical protein VW644_00860, partial [Alphaproteobacteria bacterium]